MTSGKVKEGDTTLSVRGEGGEYRVAREGGREKEKGSREEAWEGEEDLASRA